MITQEGHLFRILICNLWCLYYVWENNKQLLNIFQILTLHIFWAISWSLGCIREKRPHSFSQGIKHLSRFKISLSLSLSLSLSAHAIHYTAISEFVHVMQGTGSGHYMRFVDLCCIAYNILRNHAHLLVSLFIMVLLLRASFFLASFSFFLLFVLVMHLCSLSLISTLHTNKMLPAGIEQLRAKEDIRYLVDALALNLTNDQAAAMFQVSKKKTKLYDIMFT